MIKQKIVLVIGGIATGAIIVGASWYMSVNSTLAKIGSQTITAAELRSELEKVGGKSVLGRMIDQEVIRQTANQQNLTVSDQEIQQELDNFKKEFPSEDAFNQALANEGLTLDEFKIQVKDRMLLNKLATKDVQVSQEDIKKYYEEHGKEFVEPEQVHARHILVDTEDEAKAILDRLKKGEDFAKVAQEKSKDTSSAIKGGDLGFFERGTMVAEFDKTVFSMKVNDLSEPVKTQFGYHIIQLLEKKEAKQPTLEEVSSKIEKRLKEEKAIPVEQLIPDLRKQADVNILSSKYKDILNQPVVPAQ